MPSAFQEAVAALFRKMDVACDPTADAYTVKLRDGKLNIHLIGAQPGYLSLMASIFRLSEKTDSATLLALLEANQFSFAEPNIRFGVDPDDRQLSLWSRVLLADLDEARLAEFFDAFSQEAQAVQRWIESVTDGMAIKKRSTHQHFSRRRDSAPAATPGSGKLPDNP